jgi:hypothetical protein
MERQEIMITRLIGSGKGNRINVRAAAMLAAAA